MSAPHERFELLESTIRKVRPEDGDMQVWAGRLAQEFTVDDLLHYRGFLSHRLDEVMDDSLASPFGVGSVERSLELVKVQEVGEFLAVVEYAVEGSGFHW